MANIKFKIAGVWYSIPTIKGDKGDTGSIADLGGVISGLPAKTTPVDADSFVISDSASANVEKKLTWVNVKATLKTYFDTLYNNYTHPIGDGNLHVPATGTTNNGKVLTAGATAGSLSWTDKVTSTPTASDIGVTPVGGIASTNVQSALAELDTEKAPINNPTFTGTVSGITALMVGALPTSGGTVTGTFNLTGNQYITGNLKITGNSQSTEFIQGATGLTLNSTLYGGNYRLPRIYAQTSETAPGTMQDGDILFVYTA